MRWLTVLGDLRILVGAADGEYWLPTSVGYVGWLRKATIHLRGKVEGGREVDKEKKGGE